ncbi:hypothetical protein [Psychrobacter alimentarius]|uniref:hypothetical protein n=1 Tax=Psychrobacter alimentarius TaxID=261164 RepID=UPI00191AC02E|nr:hypothetical protein [Psychrobacter alimentarius]
MIYTNLLMKEFLDISENEIQECTLDKELDLILKEGFLPIGDCIFLEKIFPSSYARCSIEKQDIEIEFTDFSGYEVSTNRFHIEDFTDQDPFIQSIIFSNKFKKKWLIDFPLESVNITIGFQDDEVGKFATFTFHKSRNGEVVHDINSLELYDQPIYVEVLSGRSMPV